MNPSEAPIRQSGEHEDETLIRRLLRSLDKGKRMSVMQARLSGQLCARADFRVFCGAATADEAAAYIRRACGVMSRRELDHNPQARDRFHTLIRRPFAYRTGR